MPQQAVTTQVKIDFLAALGQIISRAVPTLFHTVVRVPARGTRHWMPTTEGEKGVHELARNLVIKQRPNLGFCCHNNNTTLNYLLASSAWRTPWQSLQALWQPPPPRALQEQYSHTLH